MDCILFWNEVALEANRVSHTNGKKEQTGPTLSSRALAIVHLAMYEAYARIVNDPQLPPYIPAAVPIIPPAPGASAQAAVATAAHATLSRLYDSQKPFFDQKHLQAVEAAALQGPGLAEGHAFGMQIAQYILNDRKDDPSASDDGYAFSVARGAHRPDPDNSDQGFHAPFYGALSKGFSITDRFELAPPPYNAPDYLRALREVRGRGIAPNLMGTLPNNIPPRITDQTLIGLYWGYDGAAGLGTPPRLYNQIIRVVANDRGNSEAQNARLFTLVNVAMADAGILAWDQKYIHNFWRPVVGIREHDQSMGWETVPQNNVDNDCDSSWLPLGAPATNAMNKNFITTQQTTPTFPFNQVIVGRSKNFTPNFPAYPSGHATFGAAALHMARLFYGPGPGGINNGGVAVGDRNADQLFNSLSFVSEELNGVNQDNEGTVRPRHVRNFPNGGLWQMIEENGRSRVYLGVHWVFDAFAVNNNNRMALNRGLDPANPRIAGIGGVPLGLKIAEDIFSNGMQKSPVMPRPIN
ncbi:hypothetical protein GCM10023189_38490 [Nibrella saemangeumensis]|uniref:Vanadium chloroperoxidase N-terminal domain-containing protein n=1 Tax=Nibrella saemangeumensis TaxID=1084526 RepID=A0ABP8N6G0_9BACT